MGTERRLDNLDLVVLVVSADNNVEAYMGSVWAHLAQDAIDAGEIKFPITEEQQLNPILERAKSTAFPPAGVDVDGNVATLPLPRPGSIPKDYFPIFDLDDLIKKITDLIHKIRAMKMRPATDA